MSISPADPEQPTGTCFVVMGFGKKTDFDSVSQHLQVRISSFENSENPTSRAILPRLRPPAV
jgi:hypothetical protein